MSEPLSTLDLLRQGRERYASAPCHAPQGTPVPDDSYCIVTAVEEYRMDRYNHPAVGVLKDILGVGRWGLIDWNAEHTTEEVLALFDKAIAAEEAKLKPAPEGVPQAAPRRRENAGCERERVMA